MAIEDDVRAAADRFYAALNESFSGNTGPMDEQWSHSTTVSTMLPSGGRQIGWDEVRPTWTTLAPDASADTGLTSVTVPDLVVIPVTDDVAYILGTDHLEGKMGGQPIAVQVRTTILFHRGEDGWKVVHRHGDALSR